MGHPELVEDARFVTNSERMQYHDDLDQIIESWTILRTHHEAMRLLQQAGIAAGAVLNAAEIAANPHLKEREFFQTPSDNSDSRFPGMPLRSSLKMSEIRWRGPRLGEHNEYVLCELLGRSKNEIEPIREDDIGTAFDI
jgi:crotonobetainyl-CoA:carnitine CoA-transferase CaiB-like acyl-CoA transferase